MNDQSGISMHKKAATVKKLADVDVSALATKVESLTEEDWNREQEQSPNYNKFGEPGKILQQARHITFKFADYRESPTAYTEASFWPEWEPLIAPIIDQVVTGYNYTPGFVPKVMLALLPAGAMIKPHSDGSGPSVLPHKIHVPIITNPKTYFFVVPHRFHFNVGEAYEVNNAAKHSVANAGSSPRVHLIFEYLPARP